MNIKRLIWLVLISIIVPAAGEFSFINEPVSKQSLLLAQAANEPQPPRVFLDTTYIPPTGNTINVPAGGNLQTAINQAQPGDEIVLTAGATYVAPSGGFILPPKNNPSNRWIIIRSSALANLPPAGTRVSPADAGSMPKVLSSNAYAALATQTGAGTGNVAFWRIVGIEFSLTPTALPDAATAGATNNTGLVRFGNPTETSAANQPHDIVVDRCYIHGLPRVNAKKGISLNSRATSVIDSYLSDFHSTQYDAQAVGGWNGPGPFKIVNNYLEASGENLMFGGTDPKIANLIPGDIEIRRNHFDKPLSWRAGDPSYAGIPWVVKNLLEFKNAQRVLIEGNTFEHCWQAAQGGSAIEPEVSALREAAWRAYFAGDETALGAMLPDDFIGINMFDGPFVSRDHAPPA